MARLLREEGALGEPNTDIDAALDRTRASRRGRQHRPPASKRHVPAASAFVSGNGQRHVFGACKQASEASEASSDEFDDMSSADSDAVRDYMQARRSASSCR